MRRSTLALRLSRVFVPFRECFFITWFCGRCCVAFFSFISANVVNDRRADIIPKEINLKKEARERKNISRRKYNKRNTAKTH